MYDGGTAVVRVIADAKGLTASIAAQTKSAGAISKIGSTLSNPFVLAGAAIAGVATKMALDFEGAFTRISAISNASEQDIEAWKSQVLSLSGETAQAPMELADALFFLSSAGLEAAQIMPTLEASAKASAAGLGDTADIANVTASALNAYAESGLTAAEVTDTLVAAVREGRAEPEEFAGALGRILPIAAQVGVTFDQVTGSLASLSNIGLDVNEAVTAMRGAMQALSAPGTQAANALKSLGLSAQDLLDAIESDGLFGALQLLDKAAQSQTKTQAQYIGVLRKVIPNVRALTGVLGLTGQEAKEVKAIFDATADSTGALDEAFKTTEEGAAFQFQKAMNELVVILTEFGRELLPVVLVAVEALAPAFRAATDTMKPFVNTLGKVSEIIQTVAEGDLPKLRDGLAALTALKPGLGFVADVLGFVSPGLHDAVDAFAQIPNNANLSATALDRFGQAVLTGHSSMADFAATVEDSQFAGQGLVEVLAQQKRQADLASDGIGGLTDHLIEVPGKADKTANSLRKVAHGAQLTKKQVEQLGEIMDDLGPQFDALSGGLDNVKDAFEGTSQGAAESARNLGRHQQDIATDLRKLDDLKIGDKLKARIAALGPDLVHAFVTGNAGQQQAIVNGLNVYQKAVRTSNRILAGIMRRGGITAGQNLAAGAEVGVTNGAAAAAAAAARMGHQMLEELNDALGNASASKKSRQSGRWLIEGLIKGMNDGLRDLTRMVQKIGDLITQALDDEVKDAVSKTQLEFAKGLEKRIASATKELDKLVSKYREFKDAIGGGFDEFRDLAGLVTGFPAAAEQAQQEYLAKQLELMEQIATASAAGNQALVATLQQQLEALQAPNMNLGTAIQEQVNQAKQLAKLLTDAAAAGLSKGLLAQFASQGGAAIPALEDLLANPALIDQLNQAAKQIEKAAGNTSEALGERFFGHAIRHASNRLDNLSDALVRFIARLQRMLGDVSDGIQKQLDAIQQQAQQQGQQRQQNNRPRPNGHTPQLPPGQTPPIVPPRPSTITINHNGDIKANDPDEYYRQLITTAQRRGRLNAGVTGLN